MLELVVVTTALFLLGILPSVLRCATGQASHGDHEQTVAAIDALLPQTQCGECGYPGCRPYARAIVEQGAPLNLCPPGGEATVKKLERLLGKPHRYTAPPAAENALALIDEESCIGCVKCIDACPVDAIVGSSKQLHAVIPEYCTGCELCLPPCPVDCITMVPRSFHQYPGH